MSSKKKRTRRDFLRNALTASALASESVRAEPLSLPVPSRPGVEKSEPVKIGIIGLGNISRSHIRNLKALPDRAEITAVCDIYRPRLQAGVRKTGARGYHDYQELLQDKNVEAVLICTPDHWHARMTIDALRAGKDVDVEKPMSRTIQEAREMVQVAEETGQVLAVDSEHTAHGIWEPARKAVQSGLLGKLMWSQTSRSRNSGEPPWNYEIDPEASPVNLDWDRFLGSAPSHPFDKERFFRWRRYWDYSGGIATDLYVHHITPLMKVIGPEFPARVVAGGGNWKFSEEVLEVPDTFVMTLDFPGRHSLVVGGSLGNSQELPIVIRGHRANLFFHGPSHLRPAYFILQPEAPYAHDFKERVEVAELEGTWTEKQIEQGGRSVHLPLFRVEATETESFIENFLRCVRTRETPVLDGRLGYMVQVAVSLAVDSYRTNSVKFFDAEREEVRDQPI